MQLDTLQFDDIVFCFLHFLLVSSEPSSLATSPFSSSYLVLFSLYRPVLCIAFTISLELFSRIVRRLGSLSLSFLTHFHGAQANFTLCNKHDVLEIARSFA